MRRMNRGVTVAAALVVSLAMPAAAQGPTITQVVSGLDSPRHLAIGADGTIYVAEAGTGGDACVELGELGNVCAGATGKIAAVKDGAVTTVVDGLPSGITDTGETLGASAVAVDADGTVWYLVGGPGPGAVASRDMLGEGGAALGQLYKVEADGSSTSVADLAAFETADNPDAAEPGNAEPDSNANGLAPTSDGVAVADAGGNDLLLVGADGSITTLAVFPVMMQAPPPDPAASPDPSAEPAMIPMDPVPTSVAVDGDGAYYVGLLTGFPFPPGGASVYKVDTDGTMSVYADGFTNVMDVAFGPDGSLYVLEIAHDGLLSAAPGTLPMGGLWKVPAGGGTPELLVSDGLPMPGGMVATDDGTLYISTCAVCPGGGSIVSLQP